MHVGVGVAKQLTQDRAIVDRRKESDPRITCPHQLLHESTFVARTADDHELVVCRQALECLDRQIGVVLRLQSGDHEEVPARLEAVLTEECRIARHIDVSAVGNEHRRGAVPREIVPLHCAGIGDQLSRDFRRHILAELESPSHHTPPLPSLPVEAVRHHDDLPAEEPRENT